MAQKLIDDAREETPREHTFDGIVELNNEMPRWWLGIFWVTILLAVFYVPYYHYFHPEKLPVASLEASAASIAADRDKKADAEKLAQGDGDPETILWEKYKAGGWEESARADFNAFCASCHAVDGGGMIGPNFTDDFYIHGGKLTDIQGVIINGVLEKGMVSWKGVLKPEQIQNLAFYIRQLRGTTPATAKAAEGKAVDADGNYLEPVE